MKTEWTIRKMSEEDILEVVEIEKLSFSIPWSQQAFLESLQLSHSIFLVAELEGHIVGYCGLYKVFQQGDITNVAVHPDYRGRGIAREILINLLDICQREQISDVTLEVRESNQNAISLYHSLGFEDIGIRKNFYEKPKENAIIMWKRK